MGYRESTHNEIFEYSNLKRKQDDDASPSDTHPRAARDDVGLYALPPPTSLMDEVIRHRAEERKRGEAEETLIDAMIKPW